MHLISSHEKKLLKCTEAKLQSCAKLAFVMSNLCLIQSTLGLAANLDLATGSAVRDLRQYINSDLVFSDLKFWPLCSEKATVEVVIPSGLDPKLLLVTTWSLY